MKTLRQYQYSAANHIVSEIAEGERVVAACSPVGSGKTLVVLSSMGMISEKDFTHKIVCVPQTHIGQSFHIEDRDYLQAPISKGCFPKSIRVPSTFSSRKKGTGKVKDYLSSPYKGVKDIPFLITTHQSMARCIKSLPEDCSKVLLYVDEAHHMSDILEEDKSKNATLLTDVVQEIENRGGSIVYITATPFREDGNTVFPSSVIPWTRSMADQCAEGFAPENLRHEITTLKGYHAKSIKEIWGDEVPKKTGKAEKQIYDQWVLDGKPKTIMILPAVDNADWKNKLLSYFLKKKVRVREYIGQGKEKKLREDLEKEKNCKRYDDSEIDVILACKRFDEGTDWPLCSHVYRIGMTKNLRLYIQTSGRSMRLKYDEEDLSKPRYEGMPEPHLNTSVFRSFLPEGQVSELGDELWNGFRDHVILLACHLHNFETGRQYAQVVKSLQNRLKIDNLRKRSGEPSIIRARERMFNLMTCGDRDEAKKTLLHLKNQKGSNFQDIYEEVKNSDMDSVEKAHVLWAMVSELDPSEDKAQKDLLSKISRRLNSVSNTIQGRDVRAKNPLADLILDGLLEDFGEVAEKYNHVMLSDPGDIYHTIGQFTGKDAREIADGLFQYGRYDLKKIKEGILLFYKKFNRAPSEESVDAHLFVGFDTTWKNIDSFLRRKQDSSLPSICLELGLDPISLPSATHNLSLIRKGVLNFYKDQKKAPTKQSHFASDYVKYQTTWRAINSFLTRGYKISLSDLCIQMGVQKNHNLDSIKSGINKFIESNNRPPSLSSGSAFKYVGYATTWSTISLYLRKHHNKSLSQLSQEILSNV